MTAAARVAKSRYGSGTAYPINITIAVTFATATVVSHSPAGCRVNNSTSIFIQRLISSFSRLVILRPSGAPDSRSQMPPPINSYP